MILSLALSATFMQTSVSTEIKVDAAHLGAAFQPKMYGVFLEEINHAGEGGLYSELIENRGFTDAEPPPACTIVVGKIVPPRTDHWWEGHPVDYTFPWEVTSDHPGWEVEQGSVRLVDDPLNDVKKKALSVSGPARLSNDGYWGISAKKGEAYALRIWAKGGPVGVRLVSEGGKEIGSVGPLKFDKNKFTLHEVTMVPTQSDSKATLQLELPGEKTVLSYVSLLPKATFKNRPNGLRKDLAQMIGDLKPGFIRFPGGCYVEGLTIESRSQWKDTIGPLEKRKPTFSPWGYWNTNGFGYHEFLQYCEDIGAKPLYVFSDGVSCAFRSGTFLPDEQIPALIQDTLDALEYANGPVTSKYGKMRAEAGHPKPFNLEYVEIGNEDSGAKYGTRFAKFAKVVKEKYPKSKLILSSWIAGIDKAAIGAAMADGPLDIVDEHAYKNIGWALQNFGHFDSYSRETPWSIYIGEFACNGGVGFGNFAATLNDAAYMLDMERNADIVRMGSYAPLLQRVESHQWDVNLIHFDSEKAFGRASYYACKMTAENLPTHLVKSTFQTRYPTSPVLAGLTGLGAYNTSVQFKDLVVNGQAVATDKPVTTQRGQWQTAKDLVTLQKPTDGSENWTYFGSEEPVKSVRTQARKLSGDEGFIIGIGSISGQRVQLNFGGWGNSIHAVQINSGGAGYSSRGRIEADHWYDVDIKIDGLHVTASLDGKVVIDTTLPRPDIAVASAGIDKNTGEIVVKIVNAIGSENQVKLDFGGVQVDPQATAIVLSGNLTDENTIEQPTKIVPKTSKVNLGPSLKFNAPPNSFSVLRIKFKQ
jgi:alpha-L-arabinofuranosidase